MAFLRVNKMKVLNYTLLALNLFFFVANIALWVKFGGYLQLIGILASLVGMYFAYQKILIERRIEKLTKGK